MQKLRHDDLVIPQGTTWAVRWPIVSEENDPINTNGWSVKSQVRPHIGSQKVLHEWSSELGNASVFASFIELRVSPEESSSWKWSKLTPNVFDVEVTTATGDVIRLSQGTVQLSQEATK